MNEKLLEKILVEAVQLSPGEREILASRLRVTAERGIDFPGGLGLGRWQEPEPEPLPDAKGLLGGGGESGGQE